MDIIEQTKQEMLQKNVWAVVGVNLDAEKFGYKIYKKLKSHNYKVYGINPNYEEIEGDKLYNSIKELPEKPECVNVVVNPKLTRKLLDEIKDTDIEYVWFQPGTFDEEIIEIAESYRLKIVYYDCVLVALGGH